MLELRLRLDASGRKSRSNTERTNLRSWMHAKVGALICLKLTHSVAITPLTVSVFPLQIDVSSL